jgi:hypothetical protein
MFRYLRRMDIGAEHVIAVRGRPFFAHAWVEVEGRVILDRAPSTDLTPIARIPA